MTDNGSDTISVLDRDGTVVTHVPIDIDASAREAPHHLAIDPVAGWIFVALAFPAPPTGSRDPHKAHGNAEDRGKLARLDLLNLAVKDTRDVDENPGDVILTHDRTRVLVTHYDMKRAMNVATRGGVAGMMFASLQVWDARDMRKIAERALCVAPHGITVTPDDHTAIVACYGSDELAVVDLTSPSLPSARYPLGATPLSLFLSREIRFDRGESFSHNSSLRHQHKIDWLGQIMLMQAKGLPQQPARPRPNYGVSELPCGDHTQMLG